MLVIQTFHLIIEWIYKEKENIDEYADLARDLKVLWSKKVMQKLIIFGEVKTVPEGLKKKGGATWVQKKNLDHPEHFKSQSETCRYLSYSVNIYNLDFL